MSRPLVVYGAGGHGKVVADILLCCGEVVMGFIDDSKPAGTLVLGLPVIGGSDWLRAHAASVALGVGDNDARAAVASLCATHDVMLVSAVHPSAVVSRSATVETGAVIMAHAVVNPDAMVGRGAIINTGAIVEHDCVVGEFAHLSPNVAMGGNCTVSAFAQLGIGASMLPGTAIGEHSIVGGGAFVTRDIPPYSIATGVPAKVRGGRKTQKPTTARVTASARLIGVDDPAWMRLLQETPHDVYHHPAYVRLDGGATACAIFAEAAGHALLMPLVRRPIPGIPSEQDAISPYGYGGPLWRRGEIPMPEVRRKLAEVVQGVLVKESLLSVLVRMHPLINGASRTLDELGTIVDHGETVAIDLEPEPSAIRSRMRQTHRNEIAQAEREGVVIEHDPKLAKIGLFETLYAQTMERVRALAGYRFDHDYFAGLTQLDGRAHLFLATYKDRVAASAVCFEEGQFVQYHLAAMDPELAHTHAPKLLVAKIAEWARARSNRWFHLGGGVGTRNDGVFAYKAGFSPLRWRFRTMRIISDEKRYRSISGMSATSSLRLADDFFPKYRQERDAE